MRLAEAYSSNGKLVLYEPSSAGRPDLHARAAGYANIIKYSSDRAADVEPFLPHRPKLQIVTMGSEGVRFRLASGDWTRMDVHPVEAVDPGGAGDWFTAAMISLIPRNFGEWTDSAIAESIDLAQAVAALSTLLPGARSLASTVTPDDLWRQVRLLRSGGVVDPLTLPNFEPAMTGLLCESCLLPLGI